MVATAAARHRPELGRGARPRLVRPVRSGRRRAAGPEPDPGAFAGDRGARRTRPVLLSGGRRPRHRSGCVARLAGLARDRLGVAIGCGARRIVRRCHGHGAVDADPRQVPGDRRRGYRDALGLVPGIAVLPHFATFGREWVPSVLEGRPSDDVVLVGIDERTAAVWSDDAWRVMGDGDVAVITTEGNASSGSGEGIRSSLPGPLLTSRTLRSGVDDRAGVGSRRCPTTHPSTHGS